MNSAVFGIYGTGGFGREVMPIARNCRECVPGTRFYFIDDSAERNHSINGHPVVSLDGFMSLSTTARGAVVAIGDSKIRQYVETQCSLAGLELATLRATSSTILDDVEVGPGAIICDQVMITSNVKIGRSFHANIYSYVAHDCVIGDYVTFAPAVKCNGNVIVEDYAYIGTGAILKQGRPCEPLIIGRGAIVGMGAVVTKSVPAGATVVGNPARPLHRS